MIRSISDILKNARNWVANQAALERLEPYAVKVARTVLRRVAVSNGRRLSDPLSEATLLKGQAIHWERFAFIQHVKGTTTSSMVLKLNTSINVSENFWNQLLSALAKAADDKKIR